MERSFKLNDNCSLEIGPCSCGAFHSKEEIIKLTKNKIKFLKKIYTTLGFDKPLKNPILPSLEDI